MRTQGHRPTWPPYFIAAALVGLAAFLRIWPLYGLGMRLAYLTFSPAVMIAALYGGLVPGLLATFLSCAVVLFIFPLTFNQPFIQDLSDWIGMSVFILNCAIVSVLTEVMRRARIREKQARFDLESSNAQLRAVRDTLESEVRERTSELFQANTNLQKELTERKIAEEEARASKERYKTTLLSVGDGVIATDAQGQVELMNPPAEVLTGWSLEDALGKPLEEIFQIVNEETGLKVENPVRRVMSEGIVVGLANHTLLISRQGTKFPIADSGAPIWAADGTIVGVVLVFRDQTSERDFQRTLHESEEHFRLAFENSSIGMCLVDLHGRILRVNDELCRIFGYDRHELESMNVNDITIEKDKGISTAFMDRAVRGGADRSVFEKRYSHKQGHVITAAVSSSLVHDADGTPLYFISHVQDVTLRKAAELALRESEERLKHALEVGGLGSWELDLDTGKAWRSLQHDRIFGYSELLPEWTYSMFLEHVLPEDRDMVEQRFRASALNGTECSLECRIRRHDGAVSWIWAQGRPKFGKENRITELVGLVQDITERKRTEEAVRASEERFRNFIRLAPLPICIVDKLGALSFLNDSFITTFGYTPEETPTLKDWWEQASPNAVYRDTAREAWESAVKKAALENKGIVPQEYTVKCKSGDSKVMEVSGITLEDGFLIIFVDVTGRKLAADTLQESHFFLQSALDALSAHVAVIEKDGEIIFINEAWKRFAIENDYRVSQHGVGLNYLEICESSHGESSEHAAMIAGMIRQVARGDRNEFHWEYPCHSPTQKRWFVLHATRFTTSDRTRVVLAHENISQRKQVEEDLTRLGTAIDQAAETVVITDNKGDILYVNPAFERTSGYTREEAIGKNARILSSGRHDAKFYSDMWNIISNGFVWTGHFINRNKDGVLFEEEATISPIKDGSGGISSFVAVKKDVTKEVSLQKQLLQAQKMEAIGTLSGGIAHDFNNLLQVVLGYSEFLLQEKSEEDPEFGDLQKIHQAARSGAALVKSLLTFSRKLEPKTMPLNLNRHIVEVHKLLRRTLPRMIEINTNLAEDLLEIEADPTQMEQVLMNLAVNARDAMPEGGLISIETRNIIADNEYCRDHTIREPGKYVLLSVSDTGHGMEKEIVEHIFEPFFTTKELGRGTGLGLATVYGIIEQHNGTIGCHSLPGRGTVFKIHFRPLEADSGPETVDGAIMPAFGTGTLLLVDDEDSVRELGGRILTKSGYTVLKAAAGVEALDLFRRHKDEIQLVILDLIMPGMGGQECLLELLKIAPEVKVIIASGFSSNLARKAADDAGASGFVDKPFKCMELLSEVHRTLNLR